MNTDSIAPELNKCSFCANVLLKLESYLLECLHGICNDCTVLQTTNLGMIICILCVDFIIH